MGKCALIGAPRGWSAKLHFACDKTRAAELHDWPVPHRDPPRDVWNTSHLAFPISASDVLRGAVHAKMRRPRTGTPAWSVADPLDTQVRFANVRWPITATP